MASSEQMRRENVRDEGKIEVEKDRVPKMTTHFESLAREHKDDVPVRSSIGGVYEYHSGTTGESTESDTKRSEAKKMHTTGTGTRDEETQQQVHGERLGGASLEEISNLRATAQQKSVEAIKAAEERYNKAKETGILQTPEESKHTTTTTTPAFQTKHYTAQKAMEAKEALSSKGQSAAQYAAEKGRLAKNSAVDTTITAAGYVVDKAVAAKDVTVESGKKVGSEVKDQAVVAGWGAAHYTLEKVAEATKAVSGVTSSVAGYTGETVVAAKDKVAGAGQTVVGYAGDKLAAAKDAVVSAEEKAAQYAARKKEEAKHDLERKKSSKEEKGETFMSKEQEHETRVQEVQPSSKHETFEEGGAEGKEEGGAESGAKQEQGGGGGGSVLHAIGETIVEIGQTAKELVVGQRDETKDIKEEPYTGAGEGI
ncbi:hypothetical protein BUALT_Bualt18G0030200 [Buddleja alternifolia]|uniref:Seed biotin-containing protein SBP65 n=1 Tax=Buddleja alternifolia TaxID=168488 RepID=A0AAV6WA24_9LAMI|nr:hypothetical protein BUALT_Bualt18G0030200 [Buddleja alternifolia]